MEQGLHAYYFLTFLPAVWALGISWLAGGRHVPPLVHKYQALSLAFTAFYGLIYLSYYSSAEGLAQVAATELVLGPLYGLLYGLLLWALGRFYAELSQKPFQGPAAWAVGLVALAGPLGSLAGLILGALGAAPGLDPWTGALMAQRAYLQNAYVFVVLGSIAVLSAAVLRDRGLDPWKRRSLIGSGWLLLLALPLFVLDALWPIVQLEWGWLPRGFNLHGLFFASWHLWWGFRWRAWTLAAVEASQNTARPGAAGSSPVPPPLDTAKLLQWGLSTRECEVAALVAGGLSNADIAEELKLGLGTVKNHIYHIFNKSGASSRRELALLAARPQTPGGPDAAQQ